MKDDQPVSQRPRRLAYREKIEIDKQVDEWLKNGTIVPSSSEYASPLVLVPKKNGKYQLCVEYRELNRKTVHDRYPMPIVQDQIDQLHGAKLFSTIDLKDGFHHVPVNEDSRKYTAFVTPDGQYEFTKMPFGLTNAPAVFLRHVNVVFKELLRPKIVLLYMDDVIIPAQSEEEALQRGKIGNKNS